MKRLIVIASGSKNNAVLIENDGNTILIDCGVDLRSLCTVYENFSLDINGLQAVLVTHSHGDHTRFLPTLKKRMTKKRMTVPFYSASQVEGCQDFSGVLSLDGFEISAFCCSHDVDCCGYRIALDGTVIAVATDVGNITECVLSALEGCDTVMLESNYDTQMLRYGPYRPALKQRILSDEGHLSNENCAKTVAYLASKGLKQVILAHISENNNSPLVAKSETLGELTRCGLEKEVAVFAAEPMLEVIL